MAQLPFLKKFNQIIDETDLSSNTKHLYKWRLTRLTVMTRHDVDWILGNCEETLKCLSGMEVGTQISYINTILSLFKYTKNLKSIKKKSFSNWNRKHSELKQSLTHKAPDEKNTLSIDEIKSIRDSLDKTSDDHFIIALLTYLPCNVGNLQCVKLYNTLPEDVDDDYWLIEKRGSQVKCNNHLHQVPDVLDNIVRNNLRKKARKYLIVNKSGKPYDNVHGYNVYIDRIIKRVFGKEMNLNKLRKIYRDKSG